MFGIVDKVLVTPLNLPPKAYAVGKAGRFLCGLTDDGMKGAGLLTTGVSLY